MPLRLNVGLSRKVTDNNYGSRGANVNVEMELESALITEPVKFQERIRQLFTMVRSSLKDELNGGSQASEKGTTPSSRPAPNGNGASRNDGQRPTRPATQSQVKAIYAIARSQRLNLSVYLDKRHRVQRPEDLNLNTASLVIDDLKANAQEGRRA